MANQLVTYNLISVTPIANGASLSQSGSTVTLEPGFDPNFYGIEPGDTVLVQSGSDARYNGLQTITGVSFGKVTFTLATTGLPAATGVATFNIAEVTPVTVPTAFVPGIQIQIAGNSNTLFNDVFTIRTILGGSETGRLAIPYNLTASGASSGTGGTATGLANLGDTPPSITSFSATPTSISAGGSSTLSWVTANCDAVYLYTANANGVTEPLSGSLSVSPTVTTEYTLVAIGGGFKVSKSITVTVTDGATATLSASPTSINSGQSTTLTWATTHASSQVISPTVGLVASSGSTSVSPTTNTTYTLTAVDSYGNSVSASVSIIVVGGTPTDINSENVAVVPDPVTSIMAAQPGASLSAYVGDLLNNLPSYHNMVANTRSGDGQPYRVYTLNGESGETVYGMNSMCGDGKGTFFHFLRNLRSGDTTCHVTKAKVILPGAMAYLSRAGWTASASSDDGTHLAANVLDGNQQSYWQAAGAPPQTITVDFGAEQYIDFITTRCATGVSGGHEPLAVSITADGATVGTFTANGGDTENFFDIHRICKTVAITVTDSWSSGVQISEINATIGKSLPHPTFDTSQTLDITGLPSTAGQYSWAQYLGFDDSVLFYNSGNALLYKIDAAALTVVGSAATLAGSDQPCGVTPDGQIVVFDGQIKIRAGNTTSITLTDVAVAGGNATYTYSSFTGSAPVVGMLVTVTGFSNSGNNVVNAAITAVDLVGKTITFAATTQVNETAAATGTVAFGSLIRTITFAQLDPANASHYHIAQCLLDPLTAGAAYLYVENNFGIPGASWVYHVDLDTRTVITGPIVLSPVLGYTFVANPSIGTYALFAIRPSTYSGDFNLYAFDSSLAMTTIATHIPDYGTDPPYGLNSLAMGDMSPSTASSGYTITYAMTNVTNAARNPNFLITDTYQLSVTGAPPNARLDLCVNGTWTNGFGTTDGSGNWSYSNTFLARSPSTYFNRFNQNFEAVRVNGIISNTITFTVSTTGTPSSLSGLVLTITNTSDATRNPNFLYTDHYTLNLTGADPSSAVDICVNGGWTTSFGTTDGSGNWSYNGQFNDSILDVQYLATNPYTWVLVRVNGELSTVIMFSIAFTLGNMVWIQPNVITYNAAPWYGIDVSSGRVAQTYGLAPSFNGFTIKMWGTILASSVATYTSPLIFNGLLAPSPIIGPAILKFIVQGEGDNGNNNNGGDGGGTITGGYVTVHTRGYDSALYVSDGLTGWYRMAPTMPPESGLAWSPFRQIQGGCSAVQSMETSPGFMNLLLGPPVATGKILKRDASVWTDNGRAYSSYATIGNIVLSQPGQMAGIHFITAESRALNAAGATISRPTLAVLLDEISSTTQTPFESLTTYVADPPTLTASRTLFADRFYLSQTEQPAWCRHLQLKFDWAADGKDFELLSYTLFGKQQDEG